MFTEGYRFVVYLFICVDRVFYVAQASLEFSILCLSLLEAVIIAMCHCTWLLIFLIPLSLGDEIWSRVSESA